MLVSLVRNEVWSTGPIKERKGKKVLIHWRMEVTSSWSDTLKRYSEHRLIHLHCSKITFAFSNAVFFTSVLLKDALNTTCGNQSHTHTNTAQISVSYSRCSVLSVETIIWSWCFMRFIMGTDLYLRWEGKIEVIRSWYSLRHWIMVNIVRIIKTASSFPSSQCLCYWTLRGKKYIPANASYLFGSRNKYPIKLNNQ